VAPRTVSSTQIEPYRNASAFRAVAVALFALAGLAGATLVAEAREKPANDGGAIFVAQPKITKVSCLRGCASGRRAQGGSVLSLNGSDLERVSEITFHGSAGAADDVAVKVRSQSARRLNATVPFGAVTGPVSAGTPDGRHSRPTKPLPILPAPPPEPNAELSPVPGPRQTGAPKLETGTSRTKAFFGARRTVTFSYRISQGAPSSVQVELVRTRDGSVVRTWTPDAHEAEVESVTWNGTVSRKAAAPGRYSFRLTVADGDGERASSAATGDTGRDSFDLYGHVFPIRGRHDYGGAGARFGTGRAGHSHQGQDVFAKCGTPMVAARGGRVQYSGYHAAAGNYMVIDGGATGIDYAYMHLVSPSPFKKGDRVYTGQRIGEVGDSGNASGCHLHYEMWGAPGWYEGGSAFDPFQALKSWDAYS